VYLFFSVVFIIAFINLVFLDLGVALSFVLFCCIAFSMGVFTGSQAHGLRRLLMPWLFAALAGFEMYHASSVVSGFLLTVTCWYILASTYIAGLFVPIYCSKVKESDDASFSA
jgi:hypothetical protein